MTASIYPPPTPAALPASIPLCWWCKVNPATTAEHVTKASDLATRYGGKSWAPAAAPVLVQAEERNRRVQGPKSDLVKFTRSLCEPCNTTRSQPYDRAYEHLSAHLLKNAAAIGGDGELRFDRVYGPAYAKSVAELLAYFMKIFGCGMVDGGMSPPADFVAAIGKNLVKPFSLTISINTTVRDQLSYQAFAPMQVEPAPEPGSASGVMINGMFEFRMWWKVKPFAATYGTVISRPVKKAILREVAWGSSTRYHTVK